ncbi:MAG TPA: hypothetical protein VH092_35595 [Urbifossiella sp.]|jgi:hypothetical protein|nr:hypothetical protein [Urbifossiella sp.]
MGDGPLCVLKDCVESFSDDGPLPPVPGDVDTLEDLEGHLRAAAAGPPRRFNLDLPGAVRVVLGLGGRWAAISWHHLVFDPTPPPDHPPSWHATPERPLATEGVGFRMSGREHDIPAGQLLPADDVIRLAAYIVEYRTLPGWGRWEDAQGNRYAGGARARAAEHEPDPGSDSSAIPF